MEAVDRLYLELHPVILGLENFGLEETPDRLGCVA
jgi:hypothetical protein